MRYNAFFGELPINAFKPIGGKMTLHGGGNPISAVTDAISNIGDSFSDAVIDPIKDNWVDLRDSAEEAAVVAGNYYLPGSSLLTSQLVTQGAQDQLNSDVGKVANLAAGGYGGYQGNLANYGELAGGSTGTQFSGELPNGYTPYQDPSVTTLGNVAGTTEGMTSGNALSGLGENAYTAAQDATDLAGVSNAGGAGLTGVGAIGAANMYPAVNAAAGAAAGSSLSSMLPYMAAGQVASGVLGANAAQQGASMQADAANNAIALQQKNFNTINQQQTPGRAAGANAFNTLGSLGSGTYGMYDQAGNQTGAGTGTGYLQHQFDTQDLTNGLSPNYQFQLGQGQMANQRTANAGGGALGGNALQGLNKYTQDYAGNAYQQAFNNYQTQRTGIYNTLAGIAGLGQNAQNSTNTAATNATNAASQLGIGSAAAQAAGTTGVANALGNSANSVVNNYTLASLLNQGGRVA
jgi:hypothetical protein